MEGTSSEFASLEESVKSVEHDVFTYFEKISHESKISIDAAAESTKILMGISKSGFLDNYSPAHIKVRQTRGQKPHIAFVWMALGYACAARLLIDAGMREFAWRALLDAKDFLLQARVADIQGLYYLDLSKSREEATRAKGDYGDQMREFVADTVRNAAGTRKWKSAMEAAKAVVDEAIKHQLEMKKTVFRANYPIRTLEIWMKTDPVVSEAFWATCEPSVKVAFDEKAERKRRGDRWLRNITK